jgi:transposase InsO family protein
MKDFRSILVVVPAKSSQTTLRHLVSNSIILSEWMASEVHFLVEMSETQATETLIGEFKHPDRPHWLFILLAPMTAYLKRWKNMPAILLSS